MREDSHLALQAARKRRAVYTSEERSDDIPVAAVAPKRYPIGYEMFRASCRSRLCLCKRLSYDECKGRVAGRWDGMV